MKPRLGALLTHPIQYYSPWFRDVARSADLTVYYAQQQSAEGQGKAGFAQGFEWDIPLLDGYEWRWLDNVAAHPDVGAFWGCDTPEIGKIIEQEKFDAFMMFGWNRKSFLQAGWAAFRNHVPLLVRLDSNLNAPRSALRAAIKAPLYSAVLPRAAHYLSPGVKTDDYLRHYRVPADRIHRLPHMVDTERFAAGAARAVSDGETLALRRRHGASPEHCVFAFVGKFIPKKRPALLLQALDRLRDLDPQAFGQIRVWMVGDGPLRADLEALSARQGLPVDYLGFANQSQLPAIYAAADCLVLPSNGEETWGLVVNEAFACGLPAVVSAEAGCASELIEEGRTGWVMSEADPTHLAETLRLAAASCGQLPRDRIAMKSGEASYRAGAARLVEIVAALDRRG